MSKTQNIENLSLKQLVDYCNATNSGVTIVNSKVVALYGVQ